MHVVRHNHVTPGMAGSYLIRILNCPAKMTGYLMIQEKGRSCCSHTGDKIGLPDLAAPAFTQIFTLKDCRHTASFHDVPGNRYRQYPICL